MAGTVFGQNYITLGTSGQEVAVVPLSELGSTGVRTALGNGGNPYPDRVQVRFESDPPEARVHVGEKAVGTTTTGAWVARTQLEQIHMTLEGHENCDFYDGEFSDATVTTPALFRCSF